MSKEAASDWVIDSMGYERAVKEGDRLVGPDLELN